MKEKRLEDAAEQWAAFGDEELLVWKKQSASPTLTEKLHSKVAMDAFAFPGFSQSDPRVGSSRNQHHS